jgi:alkanesulfonate monooxygenase SsuD/methylene tetrahydromethanopterin reductase-like flavin-dependent oxidoreductase (luciferase family)
MRLGVTMPRTSTDGGPLTGEALIAAARAIEGAGLDSAWCFDAIGRGFILPDPLIALAVAAAVTTRIGLGTCILQVPLRRPVELAHRPPTASHVCGDRGVLVVGACSTRGVFVSVGVDFDTRMRQLDEALAVMRRLWSGESVAAASLTPWPTTLGGPKLLIGSWSGARWIPRAAKDFDGWIASGAKTSLAILTDGIRRDRAAGGTRAIVTNVAVDLDADAPAGAMDDDAPFHLRCDAATARARLRRLAGLGFDDVVLVPPRHGEADLAALRALLPAS